jgi:hypothetical protein
LGGIGPGGGPVGETTIGVTTIGVTTIGVTTIGVTTIGLDGRGVVGVDGGGNMGNCLNGLSDVLGDSPGLVQGLVHDGPGLKI